MHGSSLSEHHNTISPPRLNEGEPPLKVTEPACVEQKF